jgi:hypothetical protein
MRLRCAAVGFMLLFVTFAASSESHKVGELEIRAAIVAKSNAAFNESNFAALEKQSQEYRLHKDRTPSGVWKLTLFYRGIIDAIDTSLNGAPNGWDKVPSTIGRWEEQHPTFPSAHISRSIGLIARAGKIRGSDIASRVNPNAWKPYHEAITDARRNLETYKNVSSIDPEWYEEMLIVAKNDDWSRVQFDVLLNEGLQKEPLFYETYFSALDYLLPKWHGDIDEIDQFISDAVERTSKHEGRGMYARIYWYASQSEFEDDLFDKSNAIWPLMKTGFNDVVRAYPDYWNLNNYAKFSCIAGDKPKTKELTTRITGHVVAEAWSKDVTEAECASWANGLADGPKGQQRHRASKSRGTLTNIEPRQSPAAKLSQPEPLIT